MPEKPEIVAGLKSAVERGYSLQQAIQTFINSGYNRQDVLDSAKNINAAVISKMPFAQTEIKKPEAPEAIKSLHYPTIPQAPTPPQTPIAPKTSMTLQAPRKPLQSKQIQQPIQQPKTKSSLGLIILLTGLLIILIGALIFFLFAKEQVLDFFSKLGF